MFNLDLVVDINFKRTVGRFILQAAVLWQMNFDTRCVCTEHGWMYRNLSIRLESSLIHRRSKGYNVAPSVEQSEPASSIRGRHYIVIMSGACVEYIHVMRRKEG